MHVSMFISNAIYKNLPKLDCSPIVQRVMGFNTWCQKETLGIDYIWELQFLEDVTEEKARVVWDI